MPALPTGLVRNKNGQYYLRRRIPQDLIASYDNKKELLWSLKTSNFRDAVDLFRLEDARLMLEWERRRQKRANFLASRQLQTATDINELTQEILDLICRHYESASLAGDETRREDGTYEPSEIEDYQQAYREGLAPLKAAVAIGDVRTLGPILQQFLDLYNYRVNLPDSDYRR